LTFTLSAQARSPTPWRACHWVSCVREALPVRPTLLRPTQTTEVHKHTHTTPQHHNTTTPPHTQHHTQHHITTHNTTPPHHNTTPPHHNTTTPQHHHTTTTPPHHTTTPHHNTTPHHTTTHHNTPQHTTTHHSTTARHRQHATTHQSAMWLRTGASRNRCLPVLWVSRFRQPNQINGQHGVRSGARVSSLRTTIKEGNE
jgi:hypothetical protein